MNHLGFIYIKLAATSPTPMTPAPPDLPRTDLPRGQFMREDNPYASIVNQQQQQRQSNAAAQQQAHQQRIAADKAKRDADMQAFMEKSQGVRDAMDANREQHLREMAGMHARLDNANQVLDQQQTGAPRSQMLDLGPDRQNVRDAEAAAPEMLRQEREREAGQRPMSYSQLEDTYRRWGAGDAWRHAGSMGLNPDQVIAPMVDMAGQTTGNSRQRYMNWAQNRRLDLTRGRTRRAPTNQVLGRFHQQYLRNKSNPQAANYSRWGLGEAPGYTPRPAGEVPMHQTALTDVPRLSNVRTRR